MKNIKNMALVCLAIALIFGATACENQMPTYKEAVGLTATVSKTDYLVGETFDPSTVSAVAYFSDGSSQNLTNTEITYSIKGNSNNFSNGKFTKSGDATITFMYGGASVEKTITGYYASNVDLGNLPSTASYTSTGTATSAKPVMTGVTATATVNGQKVELPAGSFSIADADITLTSTTAGAKTTASVAKVVVYGIDVSTVTYNGAKTWEVTVDSIASDAFDEKAPYTMEVRYTWSGDETDHYVDETVTWDVYLVNTGSKAEKELEIADLYFDGLTSSTSPAAPTTNVVTLSTDSAATYTVRYKNDASKFATVTIPNGKDYVANISASIITTGDNAIKANTKATYANFEYTVTTKANETDDEKIAELWKPSSSTVRVINEIVGEAGSSFAPTLEVTYNTDKGSVTKFVTVTSVNVPS